MEQGPKRGEGDAGGTPPPGDGFQVLAYLLTGLVVYGGIGWGLDQLLGTSWLTLVGLLTGAVLSFYLIYIRIFR